jgi:hypothetical protein
MIVAAENIDQELPDRWTLIRDILVLQLKLIMDGLRDLILVPISLFVGTLSLLKGGETTGSEFYQLLRMGRRSERWINLFGAAERVYGPAMGNERFPAEDIDELVSRVESFVVDEYRKGGVTKQAKDQVDRAIDSLHKIASRRGSTDLDSD